MSALSSYNDFFAKHRQKSVYITIGNETFNANSLISQESMSLESSLCSDENLRIGACESSCFRIRIAPYDDNEAYKDKRMFVSLKVQGSAGHIVDDQGNELVDSYGNYIAYENGATSDFDLGWFTVISDKPTKDRAYRDLTCYDKMYDILNSNVIDWYNTLTFPMSVKNFRDSFFQTLGVTQQTITLVNDNFMIPGGFTSEDELSGKTIIEAICELNGVFGHINASEVFEYISVPGAETVALDHYQNGTCRYEDYETQAFTGVVAYSEGGNVGDIVGTEVNPYLMQNNPLIWGAEGTQDLEDALENLLDQIENISYRPFTVSTYGNPMLPLGTPITMTSQNGSISSIVISKYMTGIQMLKDELSALGDEYYPNDINSTTKQITRTMGKSHLFENDINKLNSEIWTIDPDTGQTVSQIQQLSNDIVLKLDSNGNIAKVELSVDADQGQIPTLNLQANKVNITSDTIQFDNNGYQVKGDVYTTKITPDNHEIFCNYSEVDHDNFPDVNFEDDTKSLEYINTYLYGQSFYNDRTPYANALRSFNLQIIRNNQFTHFESGTNSFIGQTIIHGTHFVIRPDKWTAYVSAGGYIHDDGTLEFITNMPTYIEEEMFEVSIMQMVPRTRPIIAYLEGGLADAALNLIPKPTDPQGVIIDAYGKVPIVIDPNISISQENIYDWNNKWGSSGSKADAGLVNVAGTLWNKTMSEPETRSGTVVKTITASNPQKIFTSSDLASIFGLVSMSGTFTAYLMNGDHSAQSADVIATYIQNGEVYARFNTTPSAGAYRFNYTISRY